MKKPEDNPDMRILKTSTCKTLSGKSTLTYQIGCTPESIIHLRIAKNSGGGFFSDEWITLDDILRTLEKRPEGSPIMSHFLTPLLKGKSVNTSAFILAALTHLKLLRPLPKKQRLHELLDPKPFLDQVSKLIATADVKAKGTVKRTVKKSTGTSTKKAAIKKRAMAKKKSTTRGRKTSSAQG
jgi:hypothetical protein